MKIYVALDEEKCFNPYASILIKRLREIDSTLEIRSGISIFWDEEIFTYGIIHIHWPDLLLKNTSRTPDELRERLCELKKKGVKIVATCHNFVPHFAKHPWQNEAYDIVYESCNLILHMGNYSLDLFKNSYPNSQHKILFHHIYDDRYTEHYSKLDALKKFKLSSSYRYILCLGAFRDKKERTLILGLRDFLKANSFKILAPSFSIPARPLGIRSTLKFIKNRIEAFFLNHKYNVINFSRIVDDQEIPLLGAAADFVLIQRTDILNSGNLPLGFYLKKVVVGPNTGNVGDFLKQTGNPVFDTANLSTLPLSLKAGMKLAQSNYGDNNYLFAIKNLGSKEIALQLLKLYKEL